MMGQPAPHPAAAPEAPHPGDDRLVRLAEVCRITALSTSEIYRRMDAGTFPRPKQLGPSAVAWPLSRIGRWIADLPESQNLRPARPKAKGGNQPPA